jgi:hypothetical protein
MTEYFLIIDYLRPSMKNNIMKIYKNHLFKSNIFQTEALATI